MNVLRRLSKSELEALFWENSKKIIDYFIKKSIFSQPERIEWQDILPIQIPKEHIEQWCVQSLWVKWIWAWSYPIDIFNDIDLWWADVKMVSAKTTKAWKMSWWDTWETSLAQKFEEIWNELDHYFKNKDYTSIKEKWLWIYEKKLSDVVKIKKLKNVYYFILIRWKDKLFIVWMEVILNNLDNTHVNLERTTKDSVFVSWFLDDDFWNTKIYKAKKRLELRLKAKKWIDEWDYIEFNLSNYICDKEINLLKKISEDNFSLDEYWKEKALWLFNS